MIDDHASQDEEVRRLRRLVKELMEEQDRLSREIRELKKQIASSPSPIVAAVAEDMHSFQVRDSLIEPAPPSTGGTAAPGELDLNLFRSLFLGRQDVYARLWRSAKGSSGYSPACNNEWVKGLCRKREVRCADCENRDFAELTDQVLLDHLGGKQVVGVYPLLPTGDCHFLAVDFNPLPDQWSFLASISKESRKRLESFQALQSIWDSFGHVPARQIGSASY